jgi:hypothetical protein
MADFKTHLAVATAASLLSSTYLFTTSTLLTSLDWLLLFVLGMLGGILPDIDSDHSTPTRLLFNLLGILAMGAVLHLFGAGLHYLPLLVLMALAYVGVRFGVYWFFAEMTVHRGIYHSVVAGLLLSLLLVNLMMYMKFHPFMAWAGGACLFLGFNVHLLLDEFYSVDFNGVELKASWGSAFKLIDYRRPGISGLWVAGAVGLFSVTPHFEGFVQALVQSIGHFSLTGGY